MTQRRKATSAAVLFARIVQAAHIGCGISGREGRAAVMASDYAFAQVSGEDRAEHTTAQQGSRGGVKVAAGTNSAATWVSVYMPN